MVWAHCAFSQALCSSTSTATSAALAVRRTAVVAIITVGLTCWPHGLPAAMAWWLEGRMAACLANYMANWPAPQRCCRVAACGRLWLPVSACLRLWPPVSAC